MDNRQAGRSGEPGKSPFEERVNVESNLISSVHLPDMRLGRKKAGKSFFHNKLCLKGRAYHPIFIAHFGKYRAEMQRSLALESAEEIDRRRRN